MLCFNFKVVNLKKVSQKIGEKFLQFVWHYLQLEVVRVRLMIFSYTQVIMCVLPTMANKTIVGKTNLR